MMDEFLEKPNPAIQISDADEAHLPMLSFHLLVIVEADPDTYMPQPKAVKKLNSVLDELAEKFNAEIGMEQDIEYAVPRPDDAGFPVFIWVRYEDDEVNYFTRFVELVAPDVTFNLVSYDGLEHLRWYLQGVAQQHPTWRAAVVGAMIEDDVIRIANSIQECGLSTTVIRRYCLSSQGFVNLDNLAEYDS